MGAPLKGRRDLAEVEIVSALTRVGATIDYAEKRPYDLVVGFRHATFLFEVKGPKGKPRRSQMNFSLLWAGHYQIVRSADEVLRAIGAI